MKNKTKKIMAGLGMGLALVGGGLTMTGCSMTAEQQSALDTVVKKTDEIIELVENSNKKLTQEEALRLYNFAKTRLLVNKDNVWDNMKMIVSLDSSEEGNTQGELLAHFYTFSDGKRVCYNKFEQAEESGENLYSGYFDEVVPEESETNNNGYQPIIVTQTYTCTAGLIATSLIGEMEISEEDIVGCEILENDNYKITASTIVGENRQASPTLIEIELTKDGYLVSYDCLILVTNNPEGVGYNKYVMSTKVKYEYGVLTEAEVQADIDAYKAQEAENN